jgi:hypothetical protein
MYTVTAVGWNAPTRYRSDLFVAPLRETDNTSLTAPA